VGVSVLGPFARLRIGRRKARTSAAVSYEEARLLSALDEEGCPICHETAGSDDQYWFWFFAEQYGESHTFDELTRSLGFCPTHAARLTRTSAGAFQLAVVHGVMVQRVRSVLRHGAPRPRRGETRPPSLIRPTRCPVCRDREELADRAAFWLAGFLEDERGLLGRYGQPGILCFPHLCAVARRVTAATFDGLLTVHRAAIETALRGLAELRVELAHVPGGHGDIEKPLRPALHVAVGHERGRRGPAARDRAPAPSRRRDPVRELLGHLHQVAACPVCLEVHRAWEEWVASLDAAAASRTPAMDDLLPTCPEHVWEMVRAGGGYLALATTSTALDTTRGQVVVTMRALHPPPLPHPERRLRRLERVLRGRHREFRLARGVLVRDLRCPVCERLDTAIGRTLRLLFALMEDQSHRRAVASGYGLCLRHLGRALVLDPPPDVRATLLDVEAARLAELDWELQEYLRKVVWGYRPEAKGTEESAWKRAVWRFSGSPEDPQASANA
jgi:hypothetical protein